MRFGCLQDLEWHFMRSGAAASLRKTGVARSRDIWTICHTRSRGAHILDGGHLVSISNCLIEPSKVPERPSRRRTKRLITPCNDPRRVKPSDCRKRFFAADLRYFRTSYGFQPKTHPSSRVIPAGILNYRRLSAPDECYGGSDPASWLRQHDGHNRRSSSHRPCR